MWKSTRRKKETSKRRFSKKSRLIQRDGKSCSNCRNIMYDGEITIEHIEPKSCGGSNEIGNLRLYCTKCNQKLGKKHSTCLQKYKNKRKCCREYKNYK